MPSSATAGVTNAARGAAAMAAAPSCSAERREVIRSSVGRPEIPKCPCAHERASRLVEWQAVR